MPPHGFRDDERGRNARQHRRGHAQIRPPPGVVDVVVGGGAKPGREIQRECAGHHHAAAVAGDVGRGQERLQGFVGSFDAIGVHHHVLRGRREPQRNGGEGHHRQARGRGWIAERHQSNGGNHRELRHQQPGAALAQALGEHGQGQLVDQRRPDELEGVAECGPAEVGDRGAFHAGFAQPQRQRGEDQQQRQAAGEPQERERGHLRLQVVGKRRARGAGVVLGHARSVRRGGSSLNRPLRNEWTLPRASARRRC